MLVVLKVNKITNYPPILYIVVVESNPSKPQEENNFTLESICLNHLIISLVMLLTSRKSAIFVFPRIIKMKRGKLKFLIDCVQEQKSSKISKIDSNFQKKIRHFWNEFTQERLNKLRYCTMVDCEALVFGLI